MAKSKDLITKIVLKGQSDPSLVKTFNQANSLAGKTMNKIASIGKTAAKVTGVAFTATAAAVAKMSKDATSAYADYEQLVGGIDTLFKTSSEQMQKYADVAYQTAGLSANRYMEIATSFSASMISSLGGNVEKAAKYSDRAIKDMSDNANKMGSDMEMIIGTYQSLARGNFAINNLMSAI